MNLLPALLEALIPLFVLILAGYLLRKWARVLHLDHIVILNNLVINVTLPATIFLALARAPAFPVLYTRLPVAFILAQLTTMAGAYLLGRLLRLSRPALGMLLLTGSFGNTAFLGYPVAMALMPQHFPAAVLLDELGMMILMYVSAAVITGVYGTAEDGNRISWQDALLRFVRGPIFLSVVLGLLSRTVHGHIPVALHTSTTLLVRAIGYLAQATTPLVLLALGVALRPRAAASPLLLLPCAMKLLLCPVVMWAFCHAFGLTGDLVRIGVLQAAMPTGVLVSVFCGQYGLEGPRAGGVVFATTVLAILTIPLMLALLH